MKRYSILQALHLSFYSRDLYKDVGTNWKGTGFLYLFALLAVTWAPIMVKVHGSIGEGIRKEAPKYLEQVPKMTIVRGQVSIDRPVPYTIAEPDSKTPLMVIDTSGTINSLEQAAAPTLITRDTFMYRNPNRAETRIYDLSAIEEFTIDRERVNGWIEAFRKYFAIAAYPFALAGSFVYRMLQMLLYAAIGMLIARQLKSPLDYLTVLRLASVSVTPAVIFSALRTLTGIHVPSLWLISFAIAMGYLFVAVKANAEPAP